VDNGNNGKNFSIAGERVEACPHRWRTIAGYLNNDNKLPPVIYCEASGPVILTLTNQVIYVKCPACNAKLQSAAPRLRPAL
jgi:hypothetical protein